MPLQGWYSIIMLLHLLYLFRMIATIVLSRADTAEYFGAQNSEQSYRFNYLSSLKPFASNQGYLHVIGVGQRMIRRNWQC